MSDNGSIEFVLFLQPLIPPMVDKQAQQAIYEGLLQDKQIECIYRARTNSARR